MKKITMRPPFTALLAAALAFVLAGCVNPIAPSPPAVKAEAGGGQ
jgi:hypothetical protein